MIPASLSEVDATCLTGLLQTRFPGATVTTVTVDGEVHGTATKARLCLTYAPGPQGPASLFVKGGWEEGSEILRQVGIFSREPRVYAELLPQIGVAAPDCFGAEWDEEALQGILLLEDLTASGAAIRSPESVVGVDEVHALLMQLARMHGRTAGEGLPSGPWLRDLFRDAERPGSYLRHILEEPQLRSFLALPRAAALPDRLCDPDAIRHAFDRTLAFGLADGPAVLLHGDAHVGNSYVRADGTPAFLDWQCVSRGGWAYDVCYYLVSALDLEARRKHEEYLILDYAGCIAASGGPRLTPRQAMEHYRAYMSYGFLVWLANSTSFQPEHYNAIVSARFAETMIDHGMA